MQQGWTDVPYELPNLRVENGPAPAYVRIGCFRSVADIYQAFAVQSFTDELAANANADRIQYALELIGPPRKIDLKDLGVEYPNYDASLAEYPVDTARPRHVIEQAAEKSVWGKEKSGNGVGYGFAAHRSFLTYVACVVKVEVNPDGDISIPQVDYVIDAGTVVNSNRTKSQFEGAAVFGTSIARYGEITAKNGAIEQSNFNDYQVAGSPRRRAKLTSTSWRMMLRPRASANPGCPRSLPHSAMQFSQQPESASENYRCRSKTSASRQRANVS